MRVYIAGPMRGIPQLNYPAFFAAKEHLESLGHQVVCPPMMDRALGYADWENAPIPNVTPAQLREMMLIDLVAISHCDAVYLLKGWSNSRGCAVEVAYAEFLGIPFLGGLG
jgi:hypothetical protein